MEEYKEWLEQQIERCLNDKDLQREHWAFCKAYEKLTALRQPIVSRQVSCNTCKFLPAQYDNYCSGCIKFARYELKETLR